MSGRLRTGVPAGLVAFVLALAGCGVPRSGEPTVIPAADVPYGLSSRTPTEPSTSSADATLTAAGVYLVTPEDVLVPRGRELPPAGPAEQLQELLSQLAVGPSRQERAEELSTSLPPEIELEVSDVSDGVATVDLTGLVDAPSGEESRLAVAQIVLTATSVPGITAVRLSRDGEPIDAPLPDGQLTSAPLTADAFASVLTPAPSTTPAPPPDADPTAAPPPAATPTAPPAATSPPS